MNQEVRSYAIAAGTGISCGWAAKELCENGLKSLVLGCGPMVKYREVYTTLNDDPWAYALKGELSPSDFKKQQATYSLERCQKKRSNIFSFMPSSIRTQGPNVFTVWTDTKSGVVH